MDFAFSEDQELLRGAVRKVLDEQSPLTEVRRVADSPEGYDRSLWKQLGELGFLGLVLPAKFGGAGLGWVDMTVLLEETGRALLPSPLVSTTLAATTILDAGNTAQCERWLPGLADGSRTGALALTESPSSPASLTLRGRPDGGGFVLDGEKRYVDDASQANLLVVGFRTDTGTAALAVVEADSPGVSMEDRPGLDATRRSGVVRFSDVEVGKDAVLGAPGDCAAITRALDRAAAAVTAEAIGSMQAALDITVEFAKQRVQFGSPIGRYQGVKHRLAEAYVDIESLKSLLYFAAWAIDSGSDEASRAVSEAKAFGSAAFTRIGVMGVQLHGAVGFTLEYDIQLYLKRSKWYRQAYGGEDHHAERIATLRGW